MPLRRSPRPTDRALQARRQNSLKSTGPRTAKGRGRVRLNALRHGRRSAHLARFVARMGLNWRVIRGLDTLSRAPDEALGPMLRPLIRRWLAAECGPRSRELERFERRLLDQEEGARRRADELAGLIRELLAARGVRLASPSSPDGTSSNRSVGFHRDLEAGREPQKPAPADHRPASLERTKLECAFNSNR